MKYLFVLLIITLLCLTSCAVQGTDSETADRITIISTIFPPYDFARNIAGDKADVILLLPPAANSHLYEPTPKDIIKIKEADVFLYIGGASDDWTEKILHGNGVRLMDSVNLCAGYNCGHIFFDEYDEHIWTSPVNAIYMSLAILEALCEADPINADYYRNNADEYFKKLETLDYLFRDIVNTASRNTVLFGDRFAFRYLTEEYGLEYFAAFPGCAEKTEPSAMTLTFLIDKIKNENIPVIFYGELSDKRTASSLSRETGADFMLLHSVHTVTQNELDNGIGYVELMTENAEALRQALN
jgi:zinc transport system substrate-binding protein